MQEDSEVDQSQLLNETVKLLSRFVQKAEDLTGRMDVVSAIYGEFNDRLTRPTLERASQDNSNLRKRR
jgi:hypothetical protein